MYKQKFVLVKVGFICLWWNVVVLSHETACLWKPTVAESCFNI